MNKKHQNHENLHYSINPIMDTAIKLLSEYHCSEQELKRRLEKEFMELPEVDERVNATMKRLKELNLVNDTHLASSLAERYSHKGNRFITHILQQKSIADEVIAKAITFLDDEKARALYEARRKENRNRYDPPEKVQARLFRFLSGRGFSYDSINTVIRQLKKEGFWMAFDDDIKNII